MPNFFFFIPVSYRSRWHSDNSSRIYNSFEISFMVWAPVVPKIFLRCDTSFVVPMHVEMSNIYFHVTYFSHFNYRVAQIPMRWIKRKPQLHISPTWTTTHSSAAKSVTSLTLIKRLSVTSVAKRVTSCSWGPGNIHIDGLVQDCGKQYEKISALFWICLPLSLTYLWPIAFGQGQYIIELYFICQNCSLFSGWCIIAACDSFWMLGLS